MTPQPGRLAAALLALVFSAPLLPGGNSSRATETITAIPGFSPAHAAAESQLEAQFSKIPDGAHAQAALRKLTSEPHVAGTEGSHRVAEWLRDQFRSFGFDADIVSFTAYMPLPREVQLDLIAPEKIPFAKPEPPLEQDAGTHLDHLLPAANDYSASGDITAQVIYANYGTAQDYRSLDSLGVSVRGKIVLARYGRGYRGVKAKLAEDHGAAGLILYSDPADDGYDAGDVFPNGPWRPLDSVQRGSILYTQIYPGDPTSAAGSASGEKRATPADAANLPHIPSVPISAREAGVILNHLGRQRVPSSWQGGLPLTYHVGPSDAKIHMRVAMDYAQRPVYDVVAKLRGADDNGWIILGNHHDAWVYGAADPGSGTTAVLETARSLGELVRAGWKPRRTIVICEWDAEEPGLVGSSDWVAANRAELQQKALAYINTDVGVTGPNFAGSAVPSLKDFLRDTTKGVTDPQSGESVFQAWKERLGITNDKPRGDTDAPSPRTPVMSLGAGSDFSPFLDYAGIPSFDVSFTGDYGVYHSVYDDFYWMEHFGDPDFAYHTALARVLGVMTLRLDEADVLPFDYTAYASEIARAEDELSARAAGEPGALAVLRRVTDASAEFSNAAASAHQALAAFPGDPAREAEINHRLAAVEQAFLAPDGLSGRPWYKHTIFAPGVNTGYSAETLPGIAEALSRHDSAMLQREAASLADALHRAAAQLTDIARLARPAPQQDNGN